VSDIDTEVVDSLKALDPDGRLEKMASLPGPDPAIHPASKHFFRSRWMRGW